MDQSTAELLKLHPALSLTSNDRIKCGITGHEMPAKNDVVNQHVNGKRFKRLAKEWKKPTEIVLTNREHLVENKKDAKLLYCNLTGRSIKNETIHIQRHLYGKKFQKALDHWKECQKSGDDFRCLRQWGQRSKKDDEFYDKQMEDLEDSDGDEDMTDLYPWLKDKVVEKDSGMNDSDGSENGQPESSRKRTKKGNEKSVPIRRKKEKMEID